MEKKISLTHLDIMRLVGNFNKFPDSLVLPRKISGRVSVLKQKLQKHAKEIDLARADKFQELSKKSGDTKGEIKRGSPEENEYGLFWREFLDETIEITYKVIKDTDLGTEDLPQVVMDALLPFIED